MYIQSAEIQFLALGIYDSKKGFRLMPHRKYTVFKEGFSISETTNLGYYGKDVELGNPADSLRIALLGDSYVEGLQVFDRDHFRSILQNDLTRSFGHQVEVMNFGMSGFDLSDEYCYYSLFVKKLHPDITVIIVHQSDFELKRKSVTKPNCYIDGNHVEIDDGYLQSKKYQHKVETQFFRGKTAVGDIFSKCFKLISAGQYKRIFFGKFASDFSDVSPHRSTKDFFVPEINRKILQELRKDHVIIAYFGKMSSDSIAVLNIFGDHLINLNEPLDKLRRQNVDPYYWKATNREGHWNHEAHIAIGQYLAQQINMIIADEIPYE